MSVFYSDKTPAESIVLTVDFVDLMQTSETINSATWNITRKGSNEDTSSMKMGGVDISQSPKVMQKVTGGTVGGVYFHNIQINTSNGRNLATTVIQKVVAEN